MGSVCVCMCVCVWGGGGGEKLNHSIKFENDSDITTAL